MKSQLTSQELDDVIKAKIAAELMAQRNKPFIVSVMGQTGVGKSSLINALFNTNLTIDPVRPATKDIERIDIKNEKGHTITFCDMPGIGESENADNTYIASYRKQLLESDVVIWAIHADNRSTAFDIQTIERLLENSDPKERCLLMSKITFVLTKADMLMHESWMAGRIDKHALFTPGKTTKRILEQKALYYQELFIQSHGSDIIARTYHDGKFTINDPAFTFSERSVYYHGQLTQEMVDAFKKQYPQHSLIFERLYDNYRVIPCSAVFRYNLPRLLLIIMNKLGSNVFESFKLAVNVDNKSVDMEVLDQVIFEKVLKMCNLSIVDIQSGKTVFDLSSSTFPNEHFTSSFNGKSKKNRNLLLDIKNAFFYRNK